MRRFRLTRGYCALAQNYLLSQILILLQIMPPGPPTKEDYILVIYQITHTQLNQRDQCPGQSLMTQFHIYIQQIKQLLKSI